MNEGARCLSWPALLQVPMLAIPFLDSTRDRCHLAEGEVVMCLGGGSLVVDGRSSVVA